MAMNVKPIPTMSERVNEIRSLTAEIVNKEILPNENLLWASRTNPSLTEADRGTARELREGIKHFSNWPTIPQLYVNGDFVGGCDILTEMFQSGELETLLADKGIPHKAAA